MHFHLWYQKKKEIFYFIYGIHENVPFLYFNARALKFDIKTIYIVTPIINKAEI